MTEPIVVPARRAAVAFILITVLLDMLALGMIIPVLPKLIEAFRGGDTARAATTIAVFGTAWASMQFFASPVLGALSDHFGRRPIILLSNFGLGFDYILMALAPTLGWLFVGRVISGVTAASIPAAFAYIADVTPAEGRAKSFGLIGAAFGVGFVVGPVLGGLLSTRRPAAAVLGRRRPQPDQRDVRPVRPARVAGARAPRRRSRGSAPIRRGASKLLRTHQQLLGFAAVHFLYYLAHQSLQNVFVLYAGYRYGWDSFAVGLALGAVGVSTSIVQGMLVGPIVARFGERRTLITGPHVRRDRRSSSTGWRRPAGSVLDRHPRHGVLGSLRPVGAGPDDAARRPDRAGPASGRAHAASSTITGIVGPALFTLTFATFIGARRDWHLPGAPFLLASMLLVVAIALVWRTCD